jgi:hypothetical protein
MQGPAAAEDKALLERLTNENSKLKQELGELMEMMKQSESWDNVVSDLKEIKKRAKLVLKIATHCMGILTFAHEWPEVGELEQMTVEAARIQSILAKLVQNDAWVKRVPAKYSK